MHVDAIFIVMLCYGFWDNNCESIIIINQLLDHHIFLTGIMRHK